MKAIPKRRGYALIFVLGLVALVAGILIAFLTTATTEKSTSSGFAASTDARQLADTAVGLVQAQINHASTRGSKVAWVSQPGMVRTFDDAGKLIKAYKLYSASSMVDTAVDLGADLPKPDWAADIATWVDLNSPVTANARINFPILDPGALEDIGAIKGLGPKHEKGLDIRSAPGATAYSPAPMPVRWLYVLKDGAVVAPAGNKNTASVAGETSANPIVGRIAFWTDDESAKVNINTAGEGTFWDVPRGYTKTETMEYALKQPAKGEFQRYPGHPAMVSLSAVIPGLELQDYLGIAPRYRFGGSKGGTLAVDPKGVTNPQVTAVQPKADRFYTTVDELMFTPDRSAGILEREVLESRRFLLTANSRAPETNLFNLPRLANWPIYRLDSHNQPLPDRTSVFDRLIAFAASSGAPHTDPTPYFFQRELADDPGHDLLQIPRNLELYQYLQELTRRDIPGFGGGNFETKYDSDRDEILTQMFDYVRCTNLYDDLLASGKQFTSPITGGKNGSPGHGSAAPVYGPGDTMGQGRFETLRQMNIAVIANADASNAASNTAANKLLAEPFPSGPPVLLQAGQMRVQALVYPEIFSTMVGWRGLRPNMRIEIEGLDKFKLGGQDLQFPATGYIDLNRDPFDVSQARPYGSNLTYVYPFVERGNTNLPSNLPLSSGDKIYPFVSGPVTVAKAGPMKFQGGPVTVKFYYGTGSAAKLVQTFTMEFPDGDFPVPTLNVSSGEWTFFSDGNGIATQGRFRGANVKPPVIEEDQDQGKDVIRALVPKHSDYRLIAAMKTVGKDASGAEIYVPHPWYKNQAKYFAALFNIDSNTGDRTGRLVTNAGLRNINVPTDFPPPADTTGDFDMSPGTYFMGAGVNKPDEGDILRMKVTDPKNLQGPDGYSVPYYSNDNQSAATGPTHFSPNRIIPSPVMFGSLPTGVKAQLPWQTLLFRPLSAAEAGHKGAIAPKDHLLLDLFWMPVVEPYAISDRFSTAGKVNMNYQILPFTYIERSAPLRAVLRGEKITRIPTTDSTVNTAPTAAGPTKEYRTDLDVDQTLSQFEQRFAQSNADKNVFISASEICDLHLVPQGESLSNMAASWQNFRQTADNVRERNYATIYPKLTTKSNTYTVHFRVQSLKKAKGSANGTWTENRDAILGEYRGSTTIERFIGPSANLPDYAKDSASLDTLKPLDEFYKWRVIRNRQFTP